MPPPPHWRPFQCFDNVNPTVHGRFQSRIEATKVLSVAHGHAHATILHRAGIIVVGIVHNTLLTKGVAAANDVRRAKETLAQRTRQGIAVNVQ